MTVSSAFDASTTGPSSTRASRERDRRSVAGRRPRRVGRDRRPAGRRARGTAGDAGETIDRSIRSQRFHARARSGDDGVDDGRARDRRASTTTRVRYRAS
jgi:hypothetical protein